MKAHSHLDAGARERAALYALGAMSEPEHDLYAVHLTTCAACRAEVESLGEPVAALADLAGEAEPPLDLRGRILGRARDGSGDVAEDVRPWQRWPAGESVGLSVTPGTDARWESTVYDGVEVRRLFVDEKADRVTMLVRMAPGASYPPHRHAGTEECYVLEGDLRLDDLVMRPGDYQRVEAGFVHGVQSTRDGCLLFIVSSMHDEIIEERGA